MDDELAPDAGEIGPEATAPQRAAWVRRGLEALALWLVRGQEEIPEALGPDERELVLQRELGRLYNAHAGAAATGRRLATGATDRTVTDADHAAARRAVAQQRPFLERFVDDIADGRYRGAEALRAARSRLYGRALIGTANRAYVDHSGPDARFTWELGGCDHCSMCPELADGGPYAADELPCFPGDGSTPCLGNCCCTLVRQDGVRGPSWTEGDVGNDSSPRRGEEAKMLEKLARVAHSIKHVGDYGGCWWDPDSATVFWNMADSDGDGQEFDSYEQIERKFLAVPGVKAVEFGEERGPDGDRWQPVKYDRSKRAKAGMDDAQAIAAYDRKFTKEQREKLASSGAAMPDGGYPIESAEDLENAVRAFGRAGDPAATKRHIRKRAKALGREDLLPESWRSGGGRKAEGGSDATVCPACESGDCIEHQGHGVVGSLGGGDAADDPYLKKRPGWQAETSGAKYGEWMPGTIRFQGITVRIDQPKGSWKSGKDPYGNPWGYELHNHYGEFPGTTAPDGMPVDVYLGPEPDAPKAYVIDQFCEGRYDEPKVVLGACSEREARTIYTKNHGGLLQRQENDGRNFHQDAGCTEMTIEQLRAWLKADHSEPTALALRHGGGVPVGSAGPGEQPPRAASVGLDGLSPIGDAAGDGRRTTDDGSALAGADGTEWEEWFEGGEFALVDSAPGKPLRVKQLLTVADAINSNGRVYTRGVLEQMVREALPRVKSGVVTMHLEHPDHVVAADGQPRFVEYEERKTAVPYDLQGPDAAGKVWVCYEVKEALPQGRLVGQAFRDGRGYPISTRFRAGPRPLPTRSAGGKMVGVPTWMYFCGVDHVGVPAVRGTATQWSVLTDSMRQELGLGTAPSTARLAPGRAGLMNEKLQAAQNRLYGLLGAGIAGTDDLKAIKKARKEFGALIKTASDLGEDVKGWAQAAVDADYAIQRLEGFSGQGPTGIPGDQTGSTNPGYAPDRLAGARPYPPEPSGGAIPKLTGGAPGTDSLTADELEAVLTNAGEYAKRHGLTVGQAQAHADDQIWMRAERKKAALAATDAERKQRISAVCDALRGSNVSLKGLPAADVDQIMADVAALAGSDAAVQSAVACTDAAERETRTAAAVSALLDSRLDQYMQIASRYRLQGAGYPSAQTSQGGQVTNDPAAPRDPQAHVLGNYTHPVFAMAFRDSDGRPPAFLESVGHVLAAGDDYARRATIADPYFDHPDADATRQRRAHNLRYLMPIINQLAQFYGEANSRSGGSGFTDAQEWFQALDAISKPGESAFVDSVCQGLKGSAVAALSDSVLQANLLNQPTILTAILIQKLWDSKMLSFCEGFGPGLMNEEAGSAGWARTALPGGKMGSVFRIPVEYRDYANMSGYAGKPATYYDPGYLVPENTGVDAIQWATRWLEFGPVLRSVALQIAREAILAMGNGPLNYNAVARGLWHATHDMQLRIDKGLADEILLVSDEFQAVAVTGEACTYADNSVYPASGLVTVNLNTTKTAVAAVAAGDRSVTYGTNVKAAIRLVGAGKGGSSPYYGNGTIGNPILRPRTNFTLSTAGAISSSVANQVTAHVTGGTGAAPVQGYLDDNGQVQNYAGGGTANYAVDYNNGVLVFTSGYTALSANTGVAQDALSSVNTFDYSYSVNFDMFQVNNVTLGTGLTMSDYLMDLLRQIDATAALMASNPRYVGPDLCLGSIVASTNITGAKLFWQWASPKGTELYPNPDHYATRNDVALARTNVPAVWQNNRLVLLKSRTTKYAIEEPLTMRGPQFATDTSSPAKPVNREMMLAWEKDCIFTPQVFDNASPANNLNPVSRSIFLY